MSRGMIMERELENKGERRSMRRRQKRRKCCEKTEELRKKKANKDRSKSQKMML